MQHTIHIKAAKGTQGGWFKGTIKKYGEEFIITKDLRVVTKKTQLPSDEPLTLRITPEQDFILNYNDTSDETRNGQRQVVAELLPYHHQMVSIEGYTYYNERKERCYVNPNSGAALLFEFEDVAMNDKRNFNAIAYIRAAMNKVWDMDYREKADLLFHLDSPPMERGRMMGHKQIVIRLLEPGFGIALSKSIFPRSGKTYLEYVADDYQQADEQTSFRTTVLKAQALGGNERIIKREGSTLSYNGKIIGGNLDEAVLWFNQNPEHKKHLVKIVEKEDKLDVDDLDSVTEESVVKKFEKKTDDRELYDKARELKIRGVHLFKDPDKIKDAITHAEEIWKEVDALGLRDTIDGSSKKLYSDDIEKLITEKKKQLAKAEAV